MASRILRAVPRALAKPQAARLRGFGSVASKGPQALTASLQHWPAAQSTILPNGIRVVTEQTPHESATFGVWLDTGSRYETEAENGVAHFLEHLFFKGTAKRTRRDIEVEVENAGAHLNAYTSRESTVFYGKAYKTEVAQGMDIIADILQNSTFSPDAVERERDVILREAEEVANQQEEVIFDDLHSAAFQNCSLGRTILGTEERIRAITSADLQNFHKKHYVGNRMVVCAAGPVNHGEFVQLAQRLFSNVPEASSSAPVKERALFTGSDLRARYDDAELAHVAFGFPTPGWNDGSHVPLMVLQTMLGNWDESFAGGIHSKSKLVSTVASSHLARSVSTFNTQYSDIGLFGVYAVGEELALNDLMYTICNEMVRFAYEVESQHLTEAKNLLAINALSMLDGTTPICEEMGRQMLCYGRRVHPLEMYQRIMSVTAEDIKEVANQIIYDRDFALAAHGPIHGLPDYNFLRRRTYWLRY